jgi:lipase maturation factor 1
VGSAPATVINRLFSSEQAARDRLLPRWLFLRCLGLIYFSAFYSLAFQIRGLIGPDGILPADRYLQQAAQSLGRLERLWYAPTLLWFSTSSHVLMALCWTGIIASLLLVLNVWPRGMLVICFVCFLSFVSAAQDFSSYQSDGMLLEAGFISLFFAPAGLWPGLGAASAPSRASLFLLQWEWFRIYFQSGAVKLLSHDVQWRTFTAMDEYYQNGPLPTWIGWYAQHLPHWFHAGSVVATFVLELGIVWMLFLPRRWRIVCFFIATIWQIPVILTANYAFLNYLVLVLGVLLLDDKFLSGIMPKGWKSRLALGPQPRADGNAEHAAGQDLRSRARIRQHWRAISLAVSAVLLTWIFYATTAELIWMFARIPLPTSPVVALEPFRVANQYGLFAVMTRARYEIEFQGSNDGVTWVPYEFRYKPQAPNEAPRVYAPYQPRFDWNLWFASLGTYRDYPFVTNTEVRLLGNDKDVLALFAGNPFANAPPHQVRAMLWQYWFTSLEEKRATGNWWRRELLGLYAPVLRMDADGKIEVTDWPTLGPRE